MSITELIELLKEMPESMEGLNSEGEFVILDTRKVAESLKKSLRNCDVGTAEEQADRFHSFCKSNKQPGDVYSCDRCKLNSIEDCELAWSQMPYEEEGAK